MPAKTAKREPIPINRDVLKWARDRVGLSVEDVASEGGFKPDQIREWEVGPKTPSVKQARRLAGIYERPFLEFFSKDRPNIKPPELVPDFRAHKGEKVSLDHYGLVHIQTEAEEIRLNALDLYEMLGAEPMAIPAELYAKTGETAEKVAGRARATINLPIEEQIERRSDERYKFIEVLRRRIESIGILVAKNSGLRAFGSRGLCLYAPVLPIIVFTNEATGAQAFTLAHELAHVTLKQSAISGPPGTEDWCDAFAAAFLMPTDALARFKQRPSQPTKTLDENELKSLAGRFCVSEEAMLIRLVELRYVQSAFYWEKMRPIFIERAKNFIGGGRPKYYGSRYRTSRGDLYTGLVLEAWGNGEITNHNAAEFMGIKNISHLDAIRERYGTV